MGELKVIWTKRTLEEVAAILNFSNERNKSNAYSNRLKKSIQAVVELIGKFPRIGKLSEDGNTRVFRVDKFMLLDEFEEITPRCHIHLPNSSGLISSPVSGS